MTIDEMRKDGYPATLVGCQPLFGKEYLAIYRYPGGDVCHSLYDIQNYFTVVEQ